MRRNQRRMSEFKATIRKLEDRNSILVDERNELVCLSVIDVVCIDASWILSVAVKDKKQCQLWNDCWFFQDSACIFFYVWSWKLLFYVFCLWIINPELLLSVEACSRSRETVQALTGQEQIIK